MTNGFPSLITAISTLLGVVAGLIMLLRNNKLMKSIDSAVNTKPPGAKTISEQVEELASRLPAEDAAAAKVIEKDKPKPKAKPKPTA